jgi:hypothetical protein
MQKMKGRNRCVELEEESGKKLQQHQPPGAATVIDSGISVSFVYIGVC